MGVLDQAGIKYQVADRPVAVTGGKLGAEERLVKAPSLRPEDGEHSSMRVTRSCLRLAQQQLGDRDGAGIDHGVERSVGDLVEHDRVERLAGRLDADLARARQGARDAPARSQT